jgi:ribosomal protein L29
LENPMQIRVLRKTIAKLNTELKAREAKAIEA